jgi:septal ring factor EnvC (AmiA/AmiB activator)
MKRNIQQHAAAILFTGLFSTFFLMASAQSGAIAVLDSALLEAQLEYIHQNTRVYNNFRAVREDIFLKLKGNVIDTLNEEKLRVAELNSRLSERNFLIETLNTDLARTKNERDEAIKNKNSLTIFGIAMNKAVYNSAMWFIVLGLAALAVMMLVLFKRSHVVTSQTKNELQTIRKEFDEYRKNAREKYEKLVVSHHHEIMKLKNS